MKLQLPSLQLMLNVRSLTSLIKSIFHSILYFYVDEIGFFWKRMPTRIFITKDNSRMTIKPSKDKLTNPVAWRKQRKWAQIIQILIYQAAIPRILKWIEKSKHWVIWKYKKNMFGQRPHIIQLEVKKYHKNNKIPLNVLLRMNNAPFHPPFLKHNQRNIKVIFLFTSTLSFLQPIV